MLCGERWVAVPLIGASDLVRNGVELVFFSYRCVCDGALEKLCIFVVEHSH